MKNLQNRTVKFYSFWTFIIVCVFSALAFQVEKEITLHLTADETQYLLNVLQERPYKESAGLINKIIQQANADTTKKK